MPIFRHPDGSYRRYPPGSAPAPREQAKDEYTNDAHWKQVPGARPGIEIHRDGKTMRNTAPTPPPKSAMPTGDEIVENMRRARRGN